MYITFALGVSHHYAFTYINYKKGKEYSANMNMCDGIHNVSICLHCAIFSAVTPKSFSVYLVSVYTFSSLSYFFSWKLIISSVCRGRCLVSYLSFYSNWVLRLETPYSKVSVLFWIVNIVRISFFFLLFIHFRWVQTSKGFSSKIQWAIKLQRLQSNSWTIIKWVKVESKKKTEKKNYQEMRKTYKVYELFCVCVCVCGTIAY